MEESSNFVKRPLCELHYCLLEPIRMCRLAGFFPIIVATGSWNTSLRCRPKMIPYLLFFGVSIFGQILVTGFALLWLFLNTLRLITISNAIFYLTGLIAALLLHKLANNWEKMIQKAFEIEKSLLEIRQEKRGFGKYRFTAYLVMSLALVEHIMSLISKISIAMSEINEFNITEKIFEEYFTKSAPFIFNLISYSSWKAVWFMIINLQATFIWNITDVMTMCISMYLTSFFHDLNHIIRSRNQYTSLSWEKIRIFYSQLVALVKEVNSRFCYLILLSFFTNMFFICQQFFYTLNYGTPRQNNWNHKNNKSFSSFHSTIHLIYYVYSFGFLMTRACAMCLLAANVHKAAQDPQYVIGNIPAEEYTLTVQRFNRQVRYTTTALSGVYFYVTRSTLLKVASTFLTYELVLLQFNVENQVQKFDNKTGLHEYWNYTFVY